MVYGRHFRVLNISGKPTGHGAYVRTLVDRAPNVVLCRILCPPFI